MTGIDDRQKNLSGSAKVGIVARVRLLGILIAAMLAQTAAAQQPRAASIQGFVLRAGTGEPVRKAIVILNQIRGANVLQSYGTTTETDGSFGFVNVLPGEYRLAAMRDGY